MEKSEFFFNFFIDQRLKFEGAVVQKRVNLS